MKSNLLILLCCSIITSNTYTMHQQVIKIQPPLASNNPFITIAQQEQRARTLDAYLSLALYKNGMPNSCITLAKSIQPTMSLEELGDELGCPTEELNKYLTRWNLSENQLIYLIKSMQEDEIDDFCLSDWQVFHETDLMQTRQIQEPLLTESESLDNTSDIISLSSREGSAESAILSWSDFSTDSSPETSEQEYKDTHAPQAPTDDKAYYHSDYQSDSDSEDPTWQILKNKKERYHKRVYNTHKRESRAAHKN
ncbi:hypothetical protein CVU75_01300 [Candidatus Dependentiae bacterium HGW-Dependentiae-1]|nr:MAG: hypothetical protein CVU75_01300 [Candidatus Dependentiae bacterium HGW-Dependentiae-1]